MIDKNIKRFCEVILEINTINKELDKERADFYDGECAKEDVIEWRKNKQELGNKFLNENTLTYDEWIAKRKTNS